MPSSSAAVPVRAGLLSIPSSRGPSAARLDTSRSSPTLPTCSFLLLVPAVKGLDPPSLPAALPLLLPARTGTHPLTLPVLVGSHRVPSLLLPGSCCFRSSVLLL
jgi:hypothetical protein